MHCLIITATPPRRHITPQLQIQIIIRPISLANQHIQLPPVAASLHGDDRIAFESPRRCVTGLAPDEGLVGCCGVLNVEVQAGLFRLDGAANGEFVSGGFGAENGYGCWRDMSVSLGGVRGFLGETRKEDEGL
jgi:hypothetical protein